MSETTESTPTGLRAKERVIKRLAERGMSEPEIAWRFRSSPGHIQRTLRLIDVPRSRRVGAAPSAPTAIERTIVKARTKGVTHAEIAARMRRSPGFVVRVEQLAALRAEGGHVA